MSDDLAIAHWGEHCNGGGERVGWELARTFDRPLHVGTREPGIEPADVEVRELFGGGWGRRAIDHGGLAKMAAYALLWQRDVEPLQQADTIVTSGNEPLFYVPDGQQTWVAYVHHTGRHQTDLLAERWGTGLKDRLAQVVMAGQRQIMSSTASKPDVFVANSEPVARRINRYWGVPKRDIRAVYPPVPVDKYGRDAAPTEDYYLCLSRLDWHKRLGEVVEAFNGLDERLVIAGAGDEREALEAAAGDNVDLLGYVSEARKRELLAGAKAVVTNALAEDFGLTTVEPMAAGTPVIGVAEGMTQYLVQDGRTGRTYARGQLRDAVRRFDPDALWSPADIESFAARFDVETFRAGLRDVVAWAEDRAAAEHEPAWVDSPLLEEPTDPVAADGGQP
jgi:glycosyltransferase involved in cell wall biosynthesis